MGQTDEDDEVQTQGRVIAVNLSAFTRVQCTKKVLLSPDVEEDDINEAVDLVKEMVDGGEFEEDEGYWDENLAAWESATLAEGEAPDYVVKRVEGGDLDVVEAEAPAAAAPPCAETVDVVVHDLVHGVHGQSELRLVGEFLEGCLADDDSGDDRKAVCLRAVGWLEDALEEARAAIEKARDDEPDDEDDDDDDEDDEDEGSLDHGGDRDRDTDYPD